MWDILVHIFIRVRVVHKIKLVKSIGIISKHWNLHDKVLEIPKMKDKVELDT